MGTGLKVLAILLCLAAIGVTSLLMFTRVFVRPELTVEVANGRGAPVADVVVIKGNRECGVPLLQSDQTFTCHFSGVGGEYIKVRFGNPPEQVRPHGYANGGPHALLFRLTLEADGGTSFSCNRMCSNKTLADPE